MSTPGHRTDLFQRDPENVLITDFFGSVRKVEITTETISLDPNLAPMETRYFVAFFLTCDFRRWISHKYKYVFLSLCFFRYVYEAKLDFV